MKNVLFLCTGNYYRSRFAEALFNHESGLRNLEWRAFSRGLALERLHVPNPTLSPHTAERLEAAAIGLHHTSPRPIPASEGDFDSAEMIVALYESEHRPLMAERFPQWTGHTLFWDVPDLDERTAQEALGAIETQVLNLLEALEADPNL
jgi:protein-tyrosine phosphatase